MNIKKTFLFSIAVWLFLSLIMYLLSLIPFLEKNIYYFTSIWILLIIKLFFLCKWYFRDVAINTKNGFILGSFTAVSTLILGFYITIPFLKQYLIDISIFEEYFYLLVIILEIFLFCLYAGFEFDKTFTKNK
jgi:hypothetical protein